MKPVYLTAFILVSYLSTVYAATDSLVLNIATNVASGSSSTYNCSSEGNGVDPTIVWSIRYNNGTVIKTNSQLSSSIVSGGTVTTDGEVKSSVTFLVEGSYINTTRLWCGAIDSGDTTPSMQIYTGISATTTTTASLGGTCSGSVTCSTGFASCVSSVCRCNSGYYDTNGDSNSGGSCSRKASLGGTCQAGNDNSCATTNARCSSTSPYVCECTTDYVQSGSTCIPDSVGLGQSCVSPSRTCYVSYSYCNGSICVCNTGYYRSATVCVISPAGYGETCVSPTRTCPLNAYCYSVTGTCQCNTGYTYSSSLTYCISSSAGIGQSCINPTRSCPTNAGCVSGTCQCNSGSTYSSTLGYCVTSSAGISESCTNPTRSCPTNAGCVSGTCQCNSGNTYSSSLGYCVSSSAGISESCTNPTRSCPTNAACVSGTCQCNSGYTYSSSLGYCVASSAGISESCINPTRACPTNAGCVSGTCQCNSGYTYSSSLGYCISSTANAAESCVSPTRSCVSNAACTASTCQCVSGYYTLSGACYQKAALGGSCSTSVTDSCSDTHASCTGSSPTCQCNSGYSNTNGACVVTSTSCPSGSDSSSTVTGNTSPSTPSVTVGQTCYEVDLYGTMVLECKDSKGSSGLQSARWLKAPAYSQVTTSTGSFINGDIAKPNLTVSNAQNSYAGDYVCQLCYGTSYTQCTNGSAITLLVRGTAITSVSASVSSTTPLRGSQVTFTCSALPTGAATSFSWLLNTTEVSTSATYTISSIGTSQDGTYKCQVSNNYNSLTSSTLDVDVQSLTSASASVSSTTPLRGSQVTFTCSVQPTGAASSYRWFLGTTQVSTSSTYTISSVGTSQDGTYICNATDSFNYTVTSNSVDLDVQYTPEPSGGTTVVTTGDLDNADIVITCNMNANPAVSYYIFYNDGDSLLQNSSSSTYTVTSSNGYQVYSCRAQNSVGLSSRQYHDVQEETTAGVGAATENTGIGTGAIAAIVIGIIFLLLLIIIIIVCCCSYGWCRKKERVEPEVIIEKPVVKPYIPRTIVSASSTVSRKDVGVMMNGHHDVSVSTDFEEPRYATPRYHLKPAVNGGPIISMYDDGYNQPRAHQLPALDTQYLYPDNEPRRHKKKKRRRHRSRHEDVSPRRQYYEAEPEPEVRYAETRQASDEDLVVVPGKQNQNYFE